jgi:predicted ATPase
VLKSVRLQNFKSFRDVRVSLGPRYFLVGPNMAGKSNFIEAFRFLKRVAFPQPGAWGLQNAFPGGFQASTWKGEDSNLVLFSLEGVTPEAEEFAEWTYEISIIGDERGAIRVQEERLILSLAGQSHELIRHQDGVRSLVNRDGRELLGSMDAARAAIEFEVPDWDGSFLRQSIARCYFYRLVPQLMRNVNTAMAPPFLTEPGDNLSAWLMHLQTRYGEAFARIRQVCRDVFPGVEELFSWPTEQGTVSIGSRERYLRQPVSMWDMSDGELVFVALLSLVFSPPEWRAALYCVEELENHLHPRLVETLLELLRQVQEEIGPLASGQVIATTHSPHLVDKVSLDELIVFEKHEGATVVTYPRNKTHLRELLQREELGLGDLFYSGALQSG